MIEHDGPLATEAVSGFIVDIVVVFFVVVFFVVVFFVVVFFVVDFFVVVIWGGFVVDCIVFIVVFLAARIAIDIVAIAGVVRKGDFDLFEEFGCRLCRVEIGFRGADGAFRR